MRRGNRSGWQRRQAPGQEMTTGYRLSVDGREVADVRLATSYRSRMVGLLGQVRPRGALLLVPCRSVHGVGMVCTLDVALLDPELQVLHLAVLPPFGLVGPRRGVRQVMEASHGSFAAWGMVVGSRLEVHPVRSPEPAGPPP